MVYFLLSKYSQNFTIREWSSDMKTKIKCHFLLVMISDVLRVYTIGQLLPNCVQFERYISNLKITFLNICQCSPKPCDSRKLVDQLLTWFELRYGLTELAVNILKYIFVFLIRFYYYYADKFYTILFWSVYHTIFNLFSFETFWLFQSSVLELYSLLSVYHSLFTPEN